MSNEEFDLRSRIRTVMNEEVAAIPSPVVTRLHASRDHALRRARRVSRMSLPWLPAAVCAASLGALMILINTVSLTTMDPLSEFEAVTTTSDLDLLEDLDFYEWLDAHHSVAG